MSRQSKGPAESLAGAGRSGGGGAGGDGGVKIALFLGAGASTPYGMPTTRDLLERIRNGEADIPLKGLLGSPGFPDIEYVLAALDDVERFAGSPGGRAYAESAKGEFPSFAAAAAQARRVIEEWIYSSYRWDPKHDYTAELILERLFKFVWKHGGRATVFTTNFDTVIEEYCKSIPEDSSETTRYIDGFVPNKARNMIVWKNDFTGGEGREVFLYKLHGSLSWSSRHNPNVYLIGSRIPAFTVQKPDTSPSDDTGRDVYIRPLLDVKYEATRKSPYAEIHRAFKKALPSFDACVAIGYSFRDRHIREAFLRFVEKGRMLIVVSPTAAADVHKNIVGWEPKEGDPEEWARQPVCHLSYSGPRGEGEIYAVHHRIGKDEMDDALNAVESIIKKEASPHRIGPLSLNPDY